MKKTLFTTVLACCMAAPCVLATEYTYENSISNGQFGTANFNGWIQSLSTEGYFDTVPTIPESVETLYLTEVQVRAGKDPGGSDDVRLAVFTTGTTNTTFGSFLGLSDVVTNTRTAGDLLTFSFENGVEWTKTGSSYDNYQFIFVSSSATETEVAALTNTAITKNNTATFRLQWDMTQTPPSGTGVYGIKSSNLVFPYNSSSGAYANYVLTDVSPAAVPEPTTATLSLLALAGLAARRRRK